MTWTNTQIYLIFLLVIFSTIETEWMIGHHLIRWFDGVFHKKIPHQYVRYFLCEELIAQLRFIYFYWKIRQFIYVLWIGTYNHIIDTSIPKFIPTVLAISSPDTCISVDTVTNDLSIVWAIIGTDTTIIVAWRILRPILVFSRNITREWVLRFILIPYLRMLSIMEPSSLRVSCPLPTVPLVLHRRCHSGRT